MCILWDDFPDWAAEVDSEGIDDAVRRACLRPPVPLVRGPMAGADDRLGRCR